MSRWTERTKPYQRPKSFEVLTPEGIWEFVDNRTRTGMDASLFFDMQYDLRQAIIDRIESQRREDRDNRVTAADLRGVVGRPRRRTR